MSLPPVRPGCCREIDQDAADRLPGAAFTRISIPPLLPTTWIHDPNCAGSVTSISATFMSSPTVFSHAFSWCSSPCSHKCSVATFRANFSAAPCPMPLDPVITSTLPTNSHMPTLPFLRDYPVFSESGARILYARAAFPPRIALVSPSVSPERSSPVTSTQRP